MIQRHATQIITVQTFFHRMSESEGSWLLTSESAEKGNSSNGIGSIESSCFLSHRLFHLWLRWCLWLYLIRYFIRQLSIRYGTKSIRHKFIYTLTHIKLCVLQCFWNKVRFDYVNDWLQPVNHDISVKHVWAMLSIQMSLIGQFLARSHFEITW